MLRRPNWTGSQIKNKSNRWEVNDAAEDARRGGQKPMRQ